MTEKEKKEIEKTQLSLKVAKDNKKSNMFYEVANLEILLNLIKKQQKEIEELKSEFALNTEIHKRDVKIKDLQETIECLHNTNNDYISKDKILKAIGYEENDEEYDRLKQDDEKLLAILDTLYSEVCRLEDIEDQKVEVAVAFIEEKRDKSWRDKIKDILKKYEKRPLEEGICFYKEIENLLEE